MEVSSQHFQDNQTRRRDLNNIYTINTFIAYSCLLYYLCLPRRILHTTAIGLSIFASLWNYYRHNSILLFSIFPRHMSRTNSDLETLYTYLEDEEFHWEPPTEDDYEEEWTELATQQSRREWLGIAN